MRRNLPALIASVAVAALVTGCSLLNGVPEPTTVSGRIAAMQTAGLDLQRPVEIRWNAHMVPWITAETDDDAAYALGYVHGWLRLGQMEIGRRAASGRLAELAGPLAADIDESLRILGYRRDAEAAYTRLPEATKRWIDRFSAGINAAMAALPELPHEYRLLGFRPEPWTPVDVMAFGRLAGSDVNWLTAVGMLKLTKRPDWPDIWRQAMEFNGGTVPSIAAAGDDSERDAATRLAWMLGTIAGFARTGSNAWAVTGAKSASGKPVLATDPHLGIQAPNLWLLVGLKSPTFEVVGMMPAGLPVFGLGRNRELAWGATNLRARSSDFVDVTGLPAGRIETQTETVGIRFGFDREVTRRITPWGPVITDAPLVEDARGRELALRWVGYQPSDELTAYLDGARATDVQAFRAAFRDYAVPGLAFVLASASGDIAIGTAARLPARPLEAPRDLVMAPPAEGMDAWGRMLGAADLPWILNPAKGYVASANNPTAPTIAPLTLFDTPPDRISVIEQRLAGADQVDRDFMGALQRDTLSPSALVLRDAVLQQAERAGMATDIPARLRAWDGRYDADSEGALLFEGLVSAMAPAIYAALGQDDVYEVIQRWSWFRVKVAADMARLTPDQLRTVFAAGLKGLAEVEAKARVWGDLHRLELSHPFSNAPLIGSRYIFSDLPTGGSNETVMKAAHSPSTERHRTVYGSQARQVNDMADPDANWFVLLGGQDGWLNAEGFSSQMPLWQSGDYIRMPLERATVEAEFTTVTMLRPKG
ncbi:MAG: penicillin acylase family protein [Pseudomonadota bacterium]|nr:penicillin acylase family protein [Pseudomonadota bacterium]